MKKIAAMRLAIADDDPHFKQLLVSELCRSKEWKPVFMACNADELLQQYQFQPCPDVIILDLYMPGISTVELIECIRKKNVYVKFLVYATIYQQHIKESLDRLHVNAYCEKQFEVIKQVLQHIRCRQQHMCHEYFEQWRHKKLNWDEKPYSNDMLAGLSARDLQIIMHLCKGKSNNAIAESLYLSERTVENNINMLLKKLNIHKRVELIDIAYRHGLCKLYSNIQEEPSTHSMEVVLEN